MEAVSFKVFVVELCFELDNLEIGTCLGCFLDEDYNDLVSSLGSVFLALKVASVLITFYFTE